MSRTPSLGGSRCSADFSSLQDSDNRPFSVQAVVCYAEAPAERSANTSQGKNKKPSVFVKAFQWYTQDHGVQKDRSHSKQEIGFAAWLDQKYEEYIWDTNSKDMRLRADGRLAGRGQLDHHSSECKEDKPKGLQRIFKGSWRKRRAAAISPEDRHDCSECKPSWQILLTPKSMSRLPSEMCAQKVSTKLCASSKVTVASSDTQVTARKYFERLGITVRGSNIHTSDVRSADSIIDPRDTETDTSLKQTQNNCSNVTISKKKIKCECLVITKDTVRTAKTDVSTENASNISKSLSNTTRPLDSKRVNVKNSETNVPFNHPVLSKVSHTNIMDSGTQYEQNMFDSQKPLDNICTAISNKNSSRIKDTNIKVKCECPVVPVEKVKREKMLSTQGDPNVRKKENPPSDTIKMIRGTNGPHSQTSKTKYYKCQCPDKSPDPQIDTEHQEWQRLGGCGQPRIQTSTQTADRVTLPISESTAVPILFRVI